MKLLLDDINCFYQIHGQGNPVILLHGLALDGRIWLEIAKLYGDQAQFIIPDLRGHGKTEIGQANGSLEQIAFDLLKLADHLQLDRFTLGGHSMGGYIALAIAEKYPERLDGLIMITSNARADAPEKKESRLMEAEQALRHGSRFIAESMAPKLSNSANIQQLSYEIIEKTSPEGFANVQRAIAARANRINILRELPVPLLAIAGMEDQLMKPEVALEMAEASCTGKSVILPGVGHMPMLEAPHTLGALIVSTLLK